MVINSNGNYSREIKRRLRLERAAVEELGKISKNKAMSLEAKATIIHTLTFPITMNRLMMLTMKKAERRGEKDSFEYGIGGELYGCPGPPERQASGS